MTTQAITVSFHGSNLFIVEYNGQPYTPMKPIVEGMGMDWASQFVKLKSGPRWGIVKTTIPTAGDTQEAICLPLRKLAGWLMTISANKVKPELRDTIIKYQNECDDVLWNYWNQHTQPTTTTPQITHATKDQRAPLVSAVRRLVKTASAKGQPLTYSEAHSIINLKMGVTHVDELSLEQIPQALILVGGLMERIVMKEKLGLPKPDGAAWISAEQYAHLRQLTFEASLPFHLRKEFKKSIWTMLKTAFSVDSVKKLSVSQFDQAVSLIQKMETKARKLSDRVTRVEREFFESVASRRFHDSDHDDLVERLLKDL